MFSFISFAGCRKSGKPEKLKCYASRVGLENYQNLIANTIDNRVSNFVCLFYDLWDLRRRASSY